MKRVKSAQLYLLLVAILGVAAIVGCTVPDDVDVDVVAPTVISTVPDDAAIDVAVDAAVTATFSEEMDPLTVIAGTFGVKRGDTLVGGTVIYAGTAATFTPYYDLPTGLTYTGMVTIGATDLAGNALEENYLWDFVVEGIPDTASPTVVSTIPADLDTDISVNTNITATFDEAMNPATIIAANFTVADGGVPVAGSVVYDVATKSATFAPVDILDTNTVYTVTITTGAEDFSDNPLAADEVWSFTTTTVAGLGPAPVRLGTAGNFAILAKTAISTVPSSAITGDIGVSPAAESYMTGFSQTKATGYSTSDQVTGFMYAADMTPPTPSNMTTAISDMETAYVDAAGRSLEVIENLGTGTIGGLTFAPGLYRWGSSVNVTTNITIDGAANDVWIFQMSGDLLVSSAVNVILGGAAQAKNIFWQVAGFASLGTTSHFEGNILCMTQINFLTGATMNGRALAQTQVTLDQSTVTEPAP